MKGWEQLAPPLCWNRSCRSSRRALVRFSSWSWRWMFSSIRAWMVSCSSNARQHTLSSTQTHTQRRAGERRILSIHLLTSERHLHMKTLAVELLQAEDSLIWQSARLRAALCFILINSIIRWTRESEHGHRFYWSNPINSTAVTTLYSMLYIFSVNYTIK